MFRFLIDNDNVFYSYDNEKFVGLMHVLDQFCRPVLPLNVELLVEKKSRKGEDENTCIHFCPQSSILSIYRISVYSFRGN